MNSLTNPWSDIERRAQICTPIKQCNLVSFTAGPKDHKCISQPYQPSIGYFSSPTRHSPQQEMIAIQASRRRLSVLHPTSTRLGKMTGWNDRLSLHSYFAFKNDSNRGITLFDHRLGASILAEVQCPMASSRKSKVHKTASCSSKDRFRCHIHLGAAPWQIIDIMKTISPLHRLHEKLLAWSRNLVVVKGSPCQSSGEIFLVY